MGISDPKAAHGIRKEGTKKLSDGNKTGGGSYLTRATKIHEAAAGAGEVSEKTKLKIEIICLLREFGHKPFDIIDRVLGLEPGNARKTHEAHHELYKAWTKKFASDALQNFYRDQITVLEILSTAMPDSISLWKKMLDDPRSKPADKERAAKEIREWTKLFLASKDKPGVRELIPDDLLQEHDEAERLGGFLAGMLGAALDVSHEDEEEMQ